jgi:hypothetical protein
VTALLLAFLQSVSHRTEVVILRRYPKAEPEIGRLLAAGHIELHGLSPRSWRITMAGRAELKRLRAEAAAGRAA